MTRAWMAPAALAIASFACVARPADPKPIAQEPTKTTEVAVPAPTQEDRPVIVTFKMRDETLRVTSTGAGPRFMVMRSDGAVISKELGDDELRDRHPELWDLYRSGYASGAPYLDATRAPTKSFVDSRVDP